MHLMKSNGAFHKYKKEDVMKQLSNEEIVKRYTELKRKEARYTAKAQLTLEKARKAGITVSEAEIDAYLKVKGK